MIKSALTEIRIFDFWVITKVYIIMCLKFLHKNWDSPTYFKIIAILGFYSFHRLRGLTPSKMEAFAPQNFHKTNKKFVSAKSGGAEPPTEQNKMVANNQIFPKR